MRECSVNVLQVLLLYIREWPYKDTKKKVGWGLKEREREREREEKTNVWSVPSNEKWQEEGKNSHRLAQYNPEWNRSPEPSAYPSCSPKESACFEFQKKETTHAKRKKKGSTLVRNETKRREQTESLIAYFHAKASTAPCVSRRTPTPASKCTPPGGIGGQIKKLNRKKITNPNKQLLKSFFCFG